MTQPLLFEPISIRGLTLRNRIVIPPMHQYQGVNGFPTAWHTVNAGRFAAGGAGLVIMESTKVERRGCGTVGDLGLWDDAFVEPLAKVVEVIKSCGAAAGIQLGHSGRKARCHRPWEGGGPLTREAANVADWDAWEIVGPSPIAFSAEYPVPRALSLAEIEDLIQAYGQSARRADQAGFDIIELHVAHGFLLHEFLSPVANQRDDAYGGSLENRMRLVLEVVDEVRRHWPDAKPLFVRLSVQDDAGWGPDESVVLSRGLKARGVDVIDCSAGGLLPAPPSSYSPSTYGYQTAFAERLRRDAGIMTMAVGNIVHGDQAEEILRSGAADLIAVGREAMNNPNWPMDVAQKLAVDPGFERVQPQVGYWLQARAKRGFGGRPSTWQTGIEIPADETLERP